MSVALQKLEEKLRLIPKLYDLSSWNKQRKQEKNKLYHINTIFLTSLITLMAFVRESLVKLKGTCAYCAIQIQMCRIILNSSIGYGSVLLLQLSLHSIIKESHVVLNY